MMEKEIEVGEYVRTKSGISKVLEVKTVQPKMYGKHDVAYLIDKCPIMYITETEFIKHSKNIIDLIEVGDFINGYKVIEVDNFIRLEKDLPSKIWRNKDIKEILTKEQYENNCYKVGE